MMSTKNRCAVIQMVSGQEPEANLQDAVRLIRSAAKKGCRLAVLPENFIAYGNPDYQKIGQSEAFNSGGILETLRQCASQNGIWIVAGTVPVCELNARPFPRVWVIDYSGKLITWYDKAHLFDAMVRDEQRMYRESSHYSPGQSVSVVQTPVGRLGVAVCYDLRFAEKFSKLRELGCNIIALPSAFTEVTGEAHWQILIQARAIETGCYILAADQGGTHPGGRKTWGQSMIVDPWGKILAEKSKGEGMVCAIIDLEKQMNYRKQIPVQEHRISRSINY